MKPQTYLIHSSTTCPVCFHEGKWTTDSSKFQMTHSRTVLPLECPKCGSTFEWEMVTGRTTSRAVVIPPPQPLGPDVPPIVAPGGAKSDDFFDNSPGENTGTLKPRPPGGIPERPVAPLPAPPPTLRPRPPGAAAPPPAVRPKPPAPPVAAPPPPKPVPKPPPLPKPLPPPESDPPMTTPTGEPKRGFWKKFDAMPLWKQWAFILVAIVIVGVVIWLLPFIPPGK